ncbi:putative 2--3'-dephosphocoenzyme-A synthase, partial [Pseudomonas cannabina]
MVDRRGSGAHTDLHLGLMHSSALSLWPTFKLMAEAAAHFGTLGQPLREALGQLGREGEVVMLRTTGGVNTHRGAIWALGLLVTAAALDPQNCGPEAVCRRAARLALIPDRHVPAQKSSNGSEVVRRYGVMGAREQAQQGFPAVTQRAL